MIDGAIGEVSAFHDTFGYYALGVQEGVATLPQGWRERLISLSSPATRGATGWCLEIHDLVISKYVANRDNDRRYCRTAAQAGMVERSLLVQRLSLTALDEQLRELVTCLIEQDFAGDEAQPAPHPVDADAD